MKKYLILSVLLVWCSSVFATHPPARTPVPTPTPTSTQVPAQGTTSAAGAIHPSISLSSLKAIKVQEKSGDEIYLTVTEYPSSGQSTHQQFPQYPQYWPSDKLDRVKDIALWNRELKTGESVILVISLIEQDAPPLNPDDLIGSVKVTLKNNNGKLESCWNVTTDQANKSEVCAPMMGQTQKVEFAGSDSQYEVTFIEK